MVFHEMISLDLSLIQNNNIRQNYIQTDPNDVQVSATTSRSSTIFVSPIIFSYGNFIDLFLLVLCMLALIQ